MTSPLEHGRFGNARAASLGGDPEGHIDVGKLMQALRRQLPLIVFCSAVGGAIAVAAILGSVPQFRAIETVLLDEERADLLEEVSPLPSVARSNSAVQSEIEIIKSQALALAVVDRLGLDENEAFLSPPVGATQEFMSRVDSLADPLRAALTPEPSGVPASDEAPAEGAGGADTSGSAGGEEIDPDRARAAQRLRSGLSASRVGRSFVINIGYETFDPALAQKIARAYGLEYRTFQLRASSETASNAGEWIQERLDVLQQQSLEAAAEVQAFRAEHDLVQVRGDLLTEQQQSDLARELIEAAAATAEAAARLESLERLVARTDDAAAALVPPAGAAQSREIFDELRREMLDARRRYRSLADEYGEDHPRAQELRRRMDSLAASMREEIEIATEAARADLEIARSREEALRENLEATVPAAGDDVAVLGRLRQLEAISDTYDAVYRDYLQRYEVTTQQQGFPIATVQILSPAELPRGATSPQKKKLLASGLFLGALIGMTIGALREVRRQPLRNASEISEGLGLPCAGLVPRGRGGWLGERRRRAVRRTLQRLRHSLDAQAPPGRPLVVGLAALSAPETDPRFLRMLAHALSDGGETRVCLVDVGGGEAGLRRTFARMPLVDIATAADIESLRAQLGRMAAPAVAAPDKVETGGRQPGWNAARNAANPAGRGAPTDAAEEDQEGEGRPRYVVLLLPPLTEAWPVGLEAMMDAAVLRVPWGRATTRLVADALADHPEFRARLATTVLEGADLRVARRYMQRGSYEEKLHYA